MNIYNTDNQELILVNAQDEVLGSLNKIEVHQQGLLHRAFSVMLYRYNSLSGIEVLLQQRHPQKYHCGSLWTNTCCGHPSPGESTILAATRRLFEETSIKTTLTHVGAFTYRANFDNGLIEHELDHVFIGQWNACPTTFNKEEITTMQWARLNSLGQEITEHPALYTPWLLEVLNLLEKHIKDAK